MSMRASDKLDLISKIGRELQGRFKFDELRSFFRHHGISSPETLISNSKWVYSKEVLDQVPLEKILDIAAELDIPVPMSPNALRMPRNWQGTSDLRLFVSHVSTHKDKAKRLKTCLAPYAIDAFVAHEDIHPTLEWQQEIERALYGMHAFLAIHTPGFSQSIWTQQEIGFAVARGVKIISLKMGEDPAGFISKHQALPRRDRTAEEIAVEIDAILFANNSTSSILEAAKKAKELILAEDSETPF